MEAVLLCLPGIHMRRHKGVNLQAGIDCIIQTASGSVSASALPNSGIPNGLDDQATPFSEFVFQRAWAKRTCAEF
jgi:hypothetical protein